jgi:hypothetical protein
MATLDDLTIDYPAGTRGVSAFFPSPVQADEPKGAGTFVERMRARIALDPDIVFIGVVHAE